MTHAHTPGPWKIREIKLYETGTGIEIVGANGEVIADNQTYYPQALNPKNATLIAAAPAMYEALKAIIEAYEEYGRADSKAEIAVSIVRRVKAEQLARAALAQAEGGVK